MTLDTKTTQDVAQIDHLQVRFCTDNGGTSMRSKTPPCPSLPGNSGPGGRICSEIRDL